MCRAEPVVVANELTLVLTDLAAIPSPMSGGSNQT